MTRIIAALFCLIAWPAAAFNMQSYFPTLAADEQLLVQTETAHYGAPIRSTLHRYVNRGTVGGNPVQRLDDYNASGFLDAWELRWNGSKMLEVADWFSPTHHKVYTVGKEISWGGVQNVNDMTSRQVHVNVAASQGETVGPQNWGTVVMTYEALLPTFTNVGGMDFTNVVVVRVFQSFCITTACTWPNGQATWITRHWLAPGLGFVQIEYIQNPNGPWNPTRFDYAISINRTWETP